MKNYIISYAQNREDVTLEAFFLGQEKGFYVDVGANDPVKDSVTKIFYEKGWRGINIEPTKRLYDSLVACRPRDINLNLGVSNKDGELSFREYAGIGDGLSTFSQTMRTSYTTSSLPVTRHTKKFKDYKVKVSTLAKILSDNKVKDIDFMKIDVEGYEYEVIEGNDWTKYRPKVICIEENHIEKDWHSLLEKNGYKKVFYDGLNEYFIDTKGPIRSQDFLYLDSVVGRQIIPHKSSQEFVKQSILNERLEADRASLQAKINEKDKHIFQLNQTIEKQKRPIHLLKMIAMSVDRRILNLILAFDKPKNTSLGHKALELKLPPSDATAEDMLKLTKEYDEKNFFAAKTKKKVTLRHVIFVGMLQSYNLVRKTLRWLLLSMLHIYRKTIGANRG